MKGGNFAQGYTIVEVMIVLAVSGVMFIIAANFIQGKQAHTSFVQGINTLNSQIQSQIESVTSGEYAGIPISCSVNASTPRKLVLNSTTPNSQGSNNGCVFLGAMLHFFVTDPEHGPVPASNYETFVLGGAQYYDSNNDPVTTIGQSALTPLTSLIGDGKTDFTRHETIPQNLQVEGMNVIIPTSTTVQKNVYSIGIAEGLGGQGVAADSYANGAQRPTLITDLNVTAGQSPPDVANNLSEQTVQVASGAVICITDGGSQHATITIGSSNSGASIVNNEQLQTVVQIHTDNECAA